MDENVKKVIIGIVFVALGILLIGEGISIQNGINHDTVTLSELFDQSDIGKSYVSDEVVYSSQMFYKVDHMLNGVIKTGTDYYYLIYSEDMQHCISLRADKKWGERFSDLTWQAITESKILGKIEKTDEKMKKYLEGEIKVTEGEKLVVDYYIDGMASERSIHYIVCGADMILLLITLVAFVWIQKSKYSNKALETVLVIILGVELLGILWSIVIIMELIKLLCRTIPMS